MSSPAPSSRPTQARCCDRVAGSAVVRSHRDLMEPREPVCAMTSCEVGEPIGVRQGKAGQGKARSAGVLMA